VKLNCKNYSIADLVFQEYTSQIQDFFSISVQFQDFSSPEKSKLKFHDFSGSVGTPMILNTNWPCTRAVATLASHWGMLNDSKTASLYGQLSKNLLSTSQTCPPYHELYRYRKLWKYWKTEVYKSYLCNRKRTGQKRSWRRCSSPVKVVLRQSTPPSNTSRAGTRTTTS